MTTYQGKLVGVEFDPDGPPDPIDLTPVVVDIGLPICVETARVVYGPTPMDVRRRLDIYRRQTGGKTTPAQQRRANKKTRKQRTP